MAKRACKARKENGSPCQAPPLHDADFCLAHSPAHAKEMAEARRLGGLRRRRERTVQEAYDFDGLGNVQQIRRIVEIAVLDTLGLENTIARARTLAYLAQVGLKALEIAEFEDRVRALEEAIAASTSASRRRR